MYKISSKPIFKVLLLIVMDILILVAVDGIALIARFEFSINAIQRQYIDASLQALLPRAAITLIIFFATHMYHYMWRNVSIRDVGWMILSVLFAYSVNFAVCALLRIDVMPRSIYFIRLFLQLFFFVGMRCSLRFANMIRNEFTPGKAQERIMLIGAGDAGRMLIKEIASSHKIPGSIVCVIDDNEAKWGKYIDGIRIIGGREEIISAAKDYRITQIIYCIPSASPEEKQAVLNICKETGCRLRNVPGIFQLVNGEVSVDAIRDVQVEDLLGREQVKLNLEALNAFISGKIVLVTGGGGSIGSELCRQIAKYSPRTLVILDIYENNAYEIQQELRRNYGASLDLRVEIASVRDREKLRELFDFYRPDLVFHAAAHKHVPLMESCPSEAIKNNIFGTYNAVCAAEEFGVRRFVMISTDKAVNPTNVMGATKRFCEMILQSRQDSKTEFCSVRFGNVLGSNGSVVPLFKKQIAEGGPVTITDKRIIRYFMTIPEAAQLVLEAGEMAGRGQIFVLDMGEPVKILTLAENLIRLSGKTPYKDIAITEIGLRPGEKLYEEMLMSSETLSATANKKIFIEQQRPIPRETIAEEIAAFSREIEDGAASEKLVALLHGFVPTFRTPEEVNSAARLKAKIEA